jgi:hypothetical protein
MRSSVTQFKRASVHVGTFVSWLLKSIIALFLVFGLVRGDVLFVFSCIIGLLLSLTPSILKRRFSVTLPWEFDFIITLALFLHIAGGEAAFGFYYNIPYWDRITHFVGSATIALFGFITVAVIDGYSEDVKFNVPMLAFFTVIFTLAMGAIWEMIEFFSDQLLLTNEQWSNADTMADLIFDLIGGLIIAIPGALYLKTIPPERFGAKFGKEIGLERYIGKRSDGKK